MGVEMNNKEKAEELGKKEFDSDKFCKKRS